MKRLLLTIFAFALAINLNAQQILKEVTFDPSGKANIANLKEVQVDNEKNEIRMFFLTKSTEKRLKGEVLYFDLDLNYKNSEKVDETLDAVKEKYKLKFSLTGCSESKDPLMTIESNMMNGQVVFKKGYIQRFYNWNTGLCDDRFKVEDKVKPKGDAGESVKLITWWTQNEIMNYQRLSSNAKYSYWSSTTTVSQGRGGNVRQLIDAENGDALFVGLVTSKSTDSQKGMNYTIQKYSASKLEKLAETDLKFDVPALPIYKQVLLNGNMAMVFFRKDSKYEYLEIDLDTKIAVRYQINSNTTQKWVINNIDETPEGTFIHGKLSAANKYNLDKLQDELMMTQYLWATRDKLEGDKTWGYQIMKMGQDGIEWIKSTPIAEFQQKFTIPPGEKTKPYDGSRLKITGLQLTKTKDILISAQIRTKGGYEYGDVVAFYYDKNGNLLNSYLTKLRDKNDYNKTTSTEVSFYNSPSTNDTYWTIFEAAGAKKRGETARVLYYPRITRIQDGGKSLSPFLEIGKREYFLDDNFPVNYMSPDTYLYLGASKNGKNLWLCKIKFD